MASLTSLPHDSGAMRRQALDCWKAQRDTKGAFALVRRNSVLKPFAKRLKERGKPHEVVIIATARRLITIAKAILKFGEK